MRPVQYAGGRVVPAKCTGRIARSQAVALGMAGCAVQASQSTLQ